MFANDHNEEVELTAQLKFPPWFSRRLHFDNFQATLGNASVIDVHKFPEKIRCLAPAPFSNINDIVRYSGILEKPQAGIWGHGGDLGAERTACARD